MSKVFGGVSRLAVVVAVAGLGLSTLAAGSAAAYTQPSTVTAECPAPAAGTFECMALVRNDLTPSMSGPVGGYGPSDLQSAYNLTSAASSGGSGTTVAIIEEGDDPNAVSDFNAYRAQYKLPACDTATEAGCLTVMGESSTSLPAANPTWAVQSSMDADAVAAICPNCHVLLAEANGQDQSDMLQTLNAAENAGARTIVVGSGDPESSSDSAQLQGVATKGVAVVVAAGNSGYGAQFPAASQFVTAVGGTTLTQDAGNARGWTESVWAGTGAGCTADQYKPSWQADTGCTGRTQNDVAADADPATGIAFYDTDGTFGGWGEGGGTNVSAAIVAGVYALAGPHTLYTYPAQYPYEATSGLYPVTTGNDGTCGAAYLCTAGLGYHGPAGLGTPDGTAAFTAPAASGITLFTRLLESFTTGRSGAADRFYALDPVASSGVTFSSSGLPAGLALAGTCETGEQICTVAITGTPTAPAGNYSATITATDTDGTTGSITVPIHVNDVVTAPTVNESATIGTAVNIPYNATSASGQSLSFSVAGLPPGISYSKTGPDQITFTGTPTTAAQTASAVTATNAYGGTATGSVIWTVHGTITIKPLANLTTPAGNSGLVTANATDSVAGASLSYNWQGLPPGITEAAGSNGNVLEGWLTTSGTYHVTLTVHDQDGATATATFTWTVTGATTAVSGPMRLVLAGKCLDDPASRTANGTRVDIWTCNGGANQKWTIAPDGTIRVFGKCLDVKGSGTANGTVVDLWTCNGGANQKWQIGSNASLTAIQSGACLDDPAFKTANGTRLDIWSCNAGRNQEWTAPAGPVLSAIPGKCMDDKGASSANGTVIDSYACNGGANQKWTVMPNGTVRVYGKCLDVKGASKTSGAKVDLYACNGGNNQQWGTYVTSDIGAELVNPISGLCLAIPGNSTANGTQLEIMNCTDNGPGDTWRIW